MALSKGGGPEDVRALQGYLDDLTFTEFMQPKGKVHAFLDHDFGNAGEKLADAAALTHRMGSTTGTSSRRG